MARKKNDPVSSAPDTSPDTTVFEQEPGNHSPWYQVSGWKLRNKIALALAFPMVAASWFATDKAIESYLVQQSHEATAGQVAVLEPALAFLYAAENSYVQTMHTAPGSEERQAAAAEVETTAQALKAVADDDALTENQKAQIKNLLVWSDDLTDTEVVRVTTASNSQATQLHNAVADYFQTIVDDQVVPERSLQQISFVMDGHIAVTQQQIYTEYDGEKILNQPDLYQWIGIERGAIESLADARPAGDPDATNLRSQNVQRQSTVTAGEGELRYQPALDLYSTINATALDEAAAALADNAAEARDKALLNMIILAASLITTLALAWLIVRITVRPVQTVRDGALAVANEHLPRAVARIRAGDEPDAITPIDVHTDEEMGELARAVDDLHRTAVNLASGEAKLRTQVGEMFVTLSRRNTSLINQQLGLIEELERDEQDPRRLENLFRLDHLAARMRRTAESLVILSDAPVRQRDAASLAVTDALQAATAGVQEYQRVELRGASPAQIVGAAANDVVHLLTELIDNALSFSPPTAPVQVSTTGGGGEVIISISDGGLGMPGDMLGQLNEMLRSSVGITPDAARRMGLFVVSRLAHRHQIGVDLAENGRGGVTASVTIPATLIVGGVATVLEAPAAPEVAPAPAPTPEQPSFEVPAPEAPEAHAAEPTRAPDPLSDPLPAEPDQQVDQINAAISAVTGLPKRRPGATVPTRVAAVNPTGSSLFGSDDAPSGGLFDRPADAVQPEPVTDEAATATVEEAAVETVAEPIVDAPVEAADEVLPVEDVFTTPSALDAPLAPEPVAVEEPAAEESEAPGAFGSMATVIDEPAVNLEDPLFGAAPISTPAPVAVDASPEPAFVEPEPEPAPEAFEPEPEVAVAIEEPVTLLPTRTAPITDEPVTPGPDEATAVDMFGSTGADTRTLPERNRDDNPAAAARMGMFNALARSPRNQARAEALSAEPSTPVQHRVAELAAEVIAETRPEAEASVPAPAAPAEPAQPSGWLSGDTGTFDNSGADAGWAAAEKVAKHVETEKTGAGLPQRRPGQRLVPGAVAPSRNTPPRDPEAIRRRLASHAAGVSRGRSATVTPNTPAKEEGQA